MAGRGEVWLVVLGMTAKARPALVLSVPPGDTDRALVTLVPHTTSVRHSAYEAAVSVPYLKSGAFAAQGLVTVPPARLIRRLGRLSGAQVAQIEVAVVAWLGLRLASLPSEG